MKIQGRLAAIVPAGLMLLALLWTAPHARAAQDAVPASPVARATLPNGLRVVVVHNGLAPVVSTSVNYLVGADEAPPGYPGMAHAQEHMMFRGSPGLSADQLADIGNIMGGDFNADTRQQVTQYLYTVPADDLDFALHIEALRMRGVDDSAAAWQHERGAIEQEVAQDLSSPSYVLFTQLRRALFEGSRYENDALGTRPSFDRTTAAMLKTFYDRWYAPNNAVLIIAGDVDPDAALTRVKQLFGDIPAKKLPPRPTIALKPVKPRSLQLKSDLSYGVQVIAMRMPGIEDPDYPACQLLADVLSSKRGALYALVPAGKALSADFSFSPLPKAGMGYAAAAYPAGSDPRQLTQQIRQILATIARDGVPADLVAAAKLQEKLGAESAKDSIEGLASAWAEAVVVDGASSPEEDLARLQRVSVQDVNRVAQRYLNLEHAVSATLQPTGAGKPVASSGFGGKEAFAMGQARPTALPDWAQRALNRLTVPASALHPVVSRLSNGLTLIVQPETQSDTVTLFGHIRNTPELEVPKGQDGLSSLLDELFGYGSERLDRLAYQQALDEIGAQAQAGSDFSLLVLKENFERAVDLLADNQLHPALPAADFKIVQRQLAGLLAGRINSPGYLFGRALGGALFPKDDPTLREARPESVSSVTLDDVRRYYHDAFRPDLTAIVVIGNVDPQQVRAVIEKYFGGWSAVGPTPETTLPPVPPNLPSQVAVPDERRVQDRVTLAQTVGMTRADADYYPLSLGNTVLGGGFYSARLSRDLRMSAGLVYSIGSSIEAGKSRTIYEVRYACDSVNVSKVHAGVVREMEQMRHQPVGADELLRAKAMLLRRLPLAESSTESIGRAMIARWDIDLALDEPTQAARRYLAMNASDIQAAFEKWLRPNDLVRVTQGPAPQ